VDHACLCETIDTIGLYGFNHSFDALGCCTPCALRNKNPAIVLPFLAYHLRSDMLSWPYCCVVCRLFVAAASSETAIPYNLQSMLVRRLFGEASMSA